MNTLNFKNRLGLALCGFFGASTLTGLFALSNIVFQTYNQTVAIILFIIVNLVCGISIFFAAKFKDNFNFNIGRIAAFVMVAMFALFAINNVTGYFDFPLFKFLGKGAGIILDSIMFILLGTFLFSSKAWLPIKIVGSIEYLINIVSCVFIIELNNAYELAKDTYDYALYDSIISAINSCTYIVLLINVTSLILTIIWMNKRSVAPSTQNQKIDLI